MSPPPLTRYSKVITESGPVSEAPESVQKAKEAADDRATVRLIKGKGVAVTFSSHFAIAVVGAAVAYFTTHQGGTELQKADAVYAQATQCVKAVEEVQADIRTLRNEMTLHNQQSDTQVSLLVMRTDMLLREKH